VRQAQQFLCDRRPLALVERGSVENFQQPEPLRGQMHDRRLLERQVLSDANEALAEERGYTRDELGVVRKHRQQCAAELVVCVGRTQRVLHVSDERLTGSITAHNRMPTGLSTSVWTRDEALAERLIRALDTGCVNVNNVMLTEGNAALPFGGVKYSGYGRMKGIEGLRGMTRSKAVMIDPTRGKPEPNWYPYSQHKLALTQQLLAALAGHGPLRYLALARVGLQIDRLVRKLAKL
jgi:hypothetical protein